MHVHTHVHSNIHTHVCTRARTHSNVHTHVYTQRHAHTRIYTQRQNPPIAPLTISSGITPHRTSPAFQRAIGPTEGSATQEGQTSRTPLLSEPGDIESSLTVSPYCCMQSKVKREGAKGKVPTDIFLQVTNTLGIRSKIAFACRFHKDGVHCGGGAGAGCYT